MEGLRQVKDGTILDVRAKTGSNQTSLYKKNDILFIELQNPPENNKANIEAVKYLRSIFNSEVSIIKGLKSKNKTFLIREISKEAAERLIENGR